MSHQARWFWQKAEECARLAREASEPDRRDHYESHAEQWRLIAEQIEAGGRVGFGTHAQWWSPWTEDAYSSAPGALPVDRLRRCARLHARPATLPRLGTASTLGQNVVGQIRDLQIKSGARVGTLADATPCEARRGDSEAV